MTMTAQRILLVTGGGRGIGAATARIAATQGYSVCVNYRRDRDAAEQVIADVRKAGQKAIAVAADVAVEADVLRLFETVDRELGPLTALVNNAGILEKQGRLEDT
ncbi:MAG: SDR family NAD(P)-dependent oxidoreductase, partial [Dokdonella sp.]